MNYAEYQQYKARIKWKYDEYKKDKILLLMFLVSVLVYILGRTIVMKFTAKPDPFTAVAVEYDNLIKRDELRMVTLSGGCFWCMEGPLESMEGVAAVIAGYAGGTEERPTY